MLISARTRNRSYCEAGGASRARKISYRDDPEKNFVKTNMKLSFILEGFAVCKPFVNFKSSSLSDFREIKLFGKINSKTLSYAK